MQAMEQKAVEQELQNQLCKAAKNGNHQDIPFLIEAGADVNHRDKDGYTALIQAVTWNKLECVHALIEAKAELNHQSETGWTALKWAIVKGHLECALSLIAAGADVNLANGNGSTPLQSAADEGYLKTVQALCNAKADVNTANNVGETPLIIAVERMHPDCARVLISVKANVNHATNLNRWGRTSGETALIKAVRGNFLDIARALLFARADVNHPNTSRTALSVALEKMNLPCATALLDAKANVIRADNFGNSPLQIAAGVLRGVRGQLNETKSRIEICELIVERMLWTPNEAQIMSIQALIKRLKKMQGYCSDIRTSVLRAFHANEIYLYNRRNFARSVGGQAVATLPEGPVKTALLNKYSPT